MDDVVLRYIERVMERHSRKQRNGFARGVLSLTADAHKMQTSQVELLDGEIVDGAERAQQYGFTCHPQPGAEVFVAFVGSDRGHAVILACDDRRYRIQSLKPGEVCIYTDEGDTITLKRENKIEVKTKHLIVQAEDDISYETKKFTVQASESFEVTTPAASIHADDLDFSGCGGGNAAATMTGTLAATGDVTSNNGGVSLNSHVHEGSNDKPVGGV